MQTLLLVRRTENLWKRCQPFSWASGLCASSSVLFY